VGTTDGKSGRVLKSFMSDIAEVKNEWICVSTHPCAFLTCTDTNLPLKKSLFPRILPSVCVSFVYSKTPASMISQQTGYSDKCCQGFLIPFNRKYYEKCHIFRFKINNVYYRSNYKLCAFFNMIFILVLFSFLCAVKSFGLLTTELHLFSDPRSLSLLQKLRNKPFIHSSVTLCSK
jgi:hypothetical protein